ncbi:MAG: cysteine desulfurase NifS [Promethearchaeota archaeon]|nr:MAG: cysteine desulfurase NifS [Candidatus Lokiarchaeota archaeon]
MKNVYLDYAATTPMDPEVIEEINTHFKETFGNASSLHTYGLKAQKVLNECREKIGLFINANLDEIFFTSSGTESDNLAIKGVAFNNRMRGNHIISSQIEHHAVLHPCQYLEKNGFKVTYLKVDNYGLIDLDELEKSITDKTILISIMFANNEIGTIEPIKEIGDIAEKHDIIFHTDAVQAFGKIPIDVKKTNVDLLSASAHKLYGPKGVGLLYIKGGGIKKKRGKYIEPLLHGGGHEKNLRSSTENIPGIAGFAKAVELCKENMNEEALRLINYRDKIINSIIGKIDDVFLNGHPIKRLPNNVNLGFRYIEGESILLSLDMEGIAVSTGSACSSKSLEPSHVLVAIGQKPEEAHGSIRITMGRFTTEEDVNYLLEKIPPIITRLRKMSPLKKGVKYLYEDPHC